MRNDKGRVVVIGGAGFIGSHLVDLLVDEGYQVEVIDNLVAGKKEYVNSLAKLHISDICNLSEITPIIKGAKYLFHLAALPSVQQSIDDPLTTNHTNIDGIVNVLVASKEGNVGKVVYSGSSAAYGEHPDLPHHEEIREKPVHPYGLQKYVGEEYARIFAKIYGLPTVTLRYFNVYGDRMNPEGPYAGVIGKFIKCKREGKPLPITGDGGQTRDFVHVRDVARANLLAAESALKNGEVINVGGGSNISIKALAELVGGPCEYIPARQEAKNSLADIRKAKALLNWEPKISIQEGIGRLLQDANF